MASMTPPHPVVSAIRENRQKYRERTGALIRELSTLLDAELSRIEHAIIVRANDGYPVAILGKDEIPRVHKMLTTLHDAKVEHADITAAVRTWAKSRPWGTMGRISAIPHYGLIRVAWRRV